jgi:Uma2 family endonuclease
MYQPQFPKSPAETLPTMYDLPSEDPEEPGLPDEFHEFQPKLLRETCQPPTYPATELFIGTDINLYYDGRHPQWYKRPDWFLSLGIDAADRQEDLRWSYVVWQESVSPYLVVELLSPGTEDEDLDRKVRELGKPPVKWEVYEKILRVPFYVVYDRYDNQLRLFSLSGNSYQAVKLLEPRFWFEELELGIGIWQGDYYGIEGKWLRWYDRNQQWILTQAEARIVAEQQAAAEVEARIVAEQQAAAELEARIAAEQQVQSAIPRLASFGLTAEQIAESLGLTIAQVQAQLDDRA